MVLNVNGVVDFGVIAPLHVLGNGSAFLLFLELLKRGELSGGIFALSALAVKIIELEMRSGEVGIEPRGRFELLAGEVVVTGLLIKDAQVVVRDRLVGDQFGHLHKFGDGLIELALFAIDDAEVEPGVWETGVLFLNREKLVYAFLGFAGAQ